jgi:leader peptidase (prepilin peptidase) / N-methyltransferase
VLAYLIVACGVLGLAVGSFANVVIYRVPREESVVRPRSHCPSCGAPINGRDNIPIISWVVLRGRCRACGVPITARYVAVEAITGALFAFDAARLGFSATLPAVLAATATLIALSAIDVERLILPKRVVYPGLALVAVLFVAASAYDQSWSMLARGAICAAAWFALFFLINLASPRALGFGDVRLAPLLGLTLGWFGYRYAVIGFFAANLLGAVAGLVLIGLGRASRREPIPYGVFLAVGTVGTILGGPWIVSWTSGIR